MQTLSPRLRLKQQNPAPLLDFVVHFGPEELVNV